MQMTVSQLSSEYSADQAVADARYDGKELLFYEVVVEEVRIVASVIEFKNGGVMFKLQDPSKWNIEPGFILNIEGKCIGLSLMEELPTIRISYIESVKGDIGGEVQCLIIRRTGAEEIRTPDFLSASEALSQLSYSPVKHIITPGYLICNPG